MLFNEESNRLTVGVSVEHEIFQDAMSGMTLVSSVAGERTFFRATSLNLHYYLLFAIISKRCDALQKHYFPKDRSQDRNTFHPKLFRAWRRHFAQPFTAKRAEI